MTVWTPADVGPTDSQGIVPSRQGNMSFMMKRLNKTNLGQPARANTYSVGIVRDSTLGSPTTTLYYQTTDADFALLQAASTGSGASRIGFTTTELANSVIVAPTGDKSSSFIPNDIPTIYTPSVWHALGDSIINGVQASVPVASQVHSCLIGNVGKKYTITGVDKNYAYDRNRYSFNSGYDSQQIRDPDGSNLAAGAGNWYDDFPLKKQNLVTAPGQILGFLIYLGTNDLAHDAAIDPVTELYTNRFIPLIQRIKAAYPTALIVFSPPAVRGSSNALNNRIVAFGNAVRAGMPSNQVDGFVEMWDVLGDPTSVWRSVKPFDARNPANGQSRATSNTAVTSVNTTTGVFTGATHNVTINGCPVFVNSFSGTGLSTTDANYMRVLSTTTWSLHPTVADAAAGTNVIIPTTTGTGTLVTAGDIHFRSDNVHPTTAGTVRFGAAMKVVIDSLVGVAA